MNSNLNTPIPTPRSLTGEGLAAAVGIMGSALLVAKRLFSAKPPKPEPMSRADFYAELVALKDHIHAGHLAILEKLDANHRELLAALGAAGHPHQYPRIRPRPRGRAHEELTMQPFAICHLPSPISQLPCAISHLPSWQPFSASGQPFLARTNSSAHNGPRAPFQNNNNNNRK